MSSNKSMAEPATPRHPREGWDATFKRATAKGDDFLLTPDRFEHEWEW